MQTQPCRWVVPAPQHVQLQEMWEDVAVPRLGAHHHGMGCGVWWRSIISQPQAEAGAAESL